MNDPKINNIIKYAETRGEYLDASSLDELKNYFATGERRVRAASVISANIDGILKNTLAKSQLYSDFTRPSNKKFTNRYYAACLRDLDYFLRYAVYALLAGNTSILDERVLNGLKETYNSLGISISTTLQAIEAMKEVTTSLVGADAGKEVGKYLDYICDGLSGYETI